jgi:hypothetical protein
VTFASVAGVGFQLAGLCVGVERGWVSRGQGEERALRILRALRAGPENRKAGLFYHFLDGDDASPAAGGPERVVSTIDSALLFAGVIAASSYFGGEVAALGDSLLLDADWTFFVAGDEAKPHERGFISLGWKPADPARPTGDGSRLPYYWIDSGDEHRLATFLAVAAPDPAHAVDPAMYYRLRRAPGEYGDTGPFVWFPWSGALFTAFFAHCYLDYAGIGVDDPGAFGVPRRMPVDWWENSRRIVRMHQLKAAENPRHLPGLGENAWGLSASDCPSGYCVPGVFPRARPVPGAIPEFDVSTFVPTDDFGDGTLAPYAAGCSVLFDPGRALAALKHYRSLRAPDGSLLVWRDPTDGGFGFLDAFRLPDPTDSQSRAWAAADCVAIDQGPLLLCIENARTGLIWRLFHDHPVVRGGLGRLHLNRNR